MYERGDLSTMRATVWLGSNEASELIGALLRSAIFELAGMPCELVHDWQTVLSIARRAESAAEAHILVVECYEGTAEDLRRCVDAVTSTTLPVWIVHPSEQCARDLQQTAGRPLVWLPADATIPMLLEKLALLRTLAADEAARPARLALTPRERQVALLVAEGKTTAEIGARLEIRDATVKTHVQTCLRKYGVTSRGALRQALRGAREDLAAHQGRAPVHANGHAAG